MHSNRVNLAAAAFLVILGIVSTGIVASAYTSNPQNKGPESPISLLVPASIGSGALGTTTVAGSYSAPLGRSQPHYPKPVSRQHQRHTTRQVDPRRFIPRYNTISRRRHPGESAPRLGHSNRGNQCDQSQQLGPRTEQDVPRIHRIRDRKLLRPDQLRMHLYRVLRLPRFL